jgi:hypothetical protein
MNGKLVAGRALFAVYINTLRLRRCARQLNRLKKSLVKLKKIEKELKYLNHDFTR